MVFFSLNNAFWWKVFSKFGVGRFGESSASEELIEENKQKSHDAKLLFNLHASGIAHHLIVSSYSFYLMYYSCQQATSGTDVSAPQPTFQWWRTDTCMMQVNKGYAFNVLISIAFMTVELIVLQKQLKAPSTLNKQTILHHYMAIGGFGVSLFAGYGYSGLSNASLICEASSVFLYIKELYTKETRNSASSQINQALFFVSFTVLRLLLFPYLTYLSIRMGILQYDLTSWFQRLLALYVILQAAAVTLLQIYWYSLILKGLKRLLEESGIKKRPAEGGDDYAELE